MRSDARQTRAGADDPTRTRAISGLLRNRTCCWRAAASGGALGPAQSCVPAFRRCVRTIGGRVVTIVPDAYALRRVRRVMRVSNGAWALV